jgi:hypothetical protein
MSQVIEDLVIGRSLYVNYGLDMTFYLLVAVRHFMFFFFLEAFVFLSDVFNEFDNCFIMVIINAILQLIVMVVDVVVF